MQVGQQTLGLNYNISTHLLDWNKMGGQFSQVYGA